MRLRTLVGLVWAARRGAPWETAILYLGTALQGLQPAAEVWVLGRLADALGQLAGAGAVPAAGATPGLGLTPAAGLAPALASTPVREPASPASCRGWWPSWRCA